MTEVFHSITEFLTSLSGLAGPAAVLAVIVALRTKKDTKAINDAVNHRKPDEKSMIELVVETHGMAERAAVMAEVAATRARTAAIRAARSDRRLAEHLRLPVSAAHPSSKD